MKNLLVQFTLQGVDPSHGGLNLISKYISDELDISMSVLMGANIANEVAREEFCEATIGCVSEADALIWKTLFHTPYFQIRTTSDVNGVELCGALKNVVAVAAGFVDGLK